MTHENRNVIVVPGLHPRGGRVPQRKAYEWAVSRWSADGFNVTVQQFGWDNKKSLKDRKTALIEAIDQMPDRLYAIGASAGALAVLGALQARPKKFEKIATVAAPLHVTETEFATFKGNPLVPLPKFLEEAYKEVDNFLSTLSIDGLSRIISLHGEDDPRVRPHWSHRPPIDSYQLSVSGHGNTIRRALIGDREFIQNFFIKPQPSSEG